VLCLWGYSAQNFEGLWCLHIWHQAIQEEKEEILLLGLPDAKYGRTIILQNPEHYNPNSIVQHPRRLESSATLL
jgi:hypothetical protein